MLNDGAIGTLCASGYPDKLTNQDVVSGLYPITERERERVMQWKKNMW